MNLDFEGLKRHTDSLKMDSGFEVLKRHMIEKTTHNPSTFRRLLNDFCIKVVSRSVALVKLIVMLDYKWKNDQINDIHEIWVLIENMDTKALLHQECFFLNERYCNDVHELNIYVPMPELLSTKYKVHTLSPTWKSYISGTIIPFDKATFPRELSPPTELLPDLQPLPLSALNNVEFEEILQQKGIELFNPIQTHLFNVCYESDENVFIGAPHGSGKLTCAELALLTHFEKHSGRNAKAVYVSFNETVAQNVFRDWKERIGRKLNKKFVFLKDDYYTDILSVEMGDVIVSTAERWNPFSQRWKHKSCKGVQDVRLFIVDDFHLMGNTSNGYMLEVICTRMQHIASELKSEIRTVILSSPLANADNVCSWLDCRHFNFPFTARPIPIDIRFQSFNNFDIQIRFHKMLGPVYSEIVRYSSTKSQSLVVFVPHFAKQLAKDFVTQAEEDNVVEQLRHYQADDLIVAGLVASIQDETLKKCVKNGVGFLQRTHCGHDMNTVETLFNMEAIHVLIIPQRLCYHVNVTAYLVIIMETELYANDHCHVNENYPITDMLHMVGIANKRGHRDAKCVIMCQSAKLFYLKNLITEPLRLESHLRPQLYNLIINEFAVDTVATKQDAFDYLEKTFLSICMSQNSDHSLNLQERRNQIQLFVDSELKFLHDYGFIKTINDMTISPLWLATTTAHYHFDIKSLGDFIAALREDTTVMELIKIISELTEFKDFPVRSREDYYLICLANERGIDISNSYNKVFILLHAYLSRQSLGGWEEHEEDMKIIVSKTMQLADICICLLYEYGWLVPLLNAMHLCQMLTQATYIEMPCVKQLADFTGSRLDCFENKSVKEIKRLLKANKEDRSFLKSTDVDMAKVVNFCSRLPVFTVRLAVSADTVELGESVTVDVELFPEYLNDDEEMSTDSDGIPAPVIAPFYPVKGRTDCWRIFIGHPEQNALCAYRSWKCVQSYEFSLEFVPKKIGRQKYHLYFMNDSYLGIDEELTFDIEVVEASVKTE